MKTFIFSLLAILIFGLAGFAKQPKVVIQPHVVTQPKLTTDVIEGLIKDRPTLLIGDWNSSGAPELPYTPDYEYSYKCQAQMTDGLNYGQGSQKYKIYAVAAFSISNGSHTIKTEDLTWYTKKRFAGNKVMDSDDKLPFSTDGSRITFGIKRGETIEEDRTFLSVYLEQSLGSIIAMESKISRGQRWDPSIEAIVHTDLRSSDGKPTANLVLQVDCDKER